MTETNPPPDAGAERAVEAALEIVARFVGYAASGRECNFGYFAGRMPQYANREIESAQEAVQKLRVWTNALAAADQARGRSWIDWRRPEEYEQDLEGKSSRRVLVYVRENHPNDPSYAPEYAALHWKFQPLTDHMIAWAEMPSPPAWAETAPPVASAQSSEASADAQAVGSAQKTPTAAYSSFTSLTVDGVPTEVRYSEQKYGGALARAATDGERSPDPAPSIQNTYGCPRGNATCQTAPRCDAARRCLADDPAPSATTHETPGAAVLAGGEDEAYRYLRRVFEHCAPQCQALPDMLGLCTQVDNLIAGYRIDLGLMPDPAAMPPARRPDATLGEQTAYAKSDLPAQGLPGRSFWDTAAARRAVDPAFAAALDEPDDATHLSDLELRVIALEKRPEWTKEKDRALAYAIGNLEVIQRLAGHMVRADQTRQVRRAAFPEPGP